MRGQQNYGLRRNCGWPAKPGGIGGVPLGSHEDSPRDLARLRGEKLQGASEIVHVVSLMIPPFENSEYCGGP